MAKNIQELVELLQGQFEMEESDAKAFVEDMFSTIVDGVKTDKTVKIKGLGSFKIVDVQDRESINVNTGERVLIEGHGKLNFTPETMVKEIVNKPFAQFETTVVQDGVKFSDIEGVDGGAASDTDDDIYSDFPTYRGEDEVANGAYEEQTVNPQTPVTPAASQFTEQPTRRRAGQHRILHPRGEQPVRPAAEPASPAAEQGPAQRPVRQPGTQGQPVSRPAAQGQAPAQFSSQGQTPTQRTVRPAGQRTVRPEQGQAPAHTTVRPAGLQMGSPAQPTVRPAAQPVRRPVSQGQTVRPGQGYEQPIQGQSSQGYAPTQRTVRPAGQNPVQPTVRPTGQHTATPAQPTVRPESHPSSAQPTVRPASQGQTVRPGQGYEQPIQGQSSQGYAPTQRTVRPAGQNPAQPTVRPESHPSSTAAAAAAGAAAVAAGAKATSNFADDVFDDIFKDDAAVAAETQKVEVVDADSFADDVFSDASTDIFADVPEGEVVDDNSPLFPTDQEDDLHKYTVKPENEAPLFTEEPAPQTSEQAFIQGQQQYVQEQQQHAREQQHAWEQQQAREQQHAQEQYQQAQERQQQAREEYQQAQEQNTQEQPAPQARVIRGEPETEEPVAGTDIYDEDKDYGETYKDDSRGWLRWLIPALAAIAIFALGYYFGMKDVLGFGGGVTAEQAVEQIAEDEKAEAAAGKHRRLASPDAPSVKPDEVRDRISDTDANIDEEELKEAAAAAAAKKAAKAQAAADGIDQPAASAAKPATGGAAAAPKDKPAAPVAQPKVQSQPTTEPAAVNSDKYNTNPRVRTGAYRIVGDDYVVTARAGDNLQKIAKRTLGPDMDCYIAVFNGMAENQTLQEGQKIKIPKLKVKVIKKK